jgi:hypothetical protein
MQSSRDSSVWRTLAVAFGDGLAFGVGVTLTRNAARLAAIRSVPPEHRSLNQRIAEMEERTRRARAAIAPPAAAPPPIPSPAVAAQAALDGRFAELGGRIDRGLAELGSKIQGDLNFLDTQDHELAEGVETRIDGVRREIADSVSAQRQEIDAEMRALRSQMTTVHKEFAETLARLVDEQIATTVTARLQAVEENLRETIREEIRLSNKDQQIAELRERIDSQERNVLDVVMALGQSCLRAMERIAPAEPPSPPPPSLPAPPPAITVATNGTAPEAPIASATQPAPALEPAAEALSADPALPAFARPLQCKPLWRIPIVSSFLLATGGLLLAHYL